MKEIKGWDFVHKVFHTRSLAAIWAVVRVWLGWQWLSAGWGKLFNPAWMDGGAALRGYFMGAVAMPEGGAAPITYDWYRTFLTALLDGGHYTWFAKLVVYGEVLVGLGLMLGAFTAIAAFFGAMMNLAFMLAGTTSTNPVLFTVAMFIIAAWKVAGWYGLDRWLLYEVGTPWQPGRILRGLFNKEDTTQPTVG